IFHSNAANQFKTAGTARLENSLIDGNCDYFQGRSETNTVTANPFTHCANLGDAYNVNFSQSGQSVKIYGSTIANVKGNVFMSIVPRGTCNGTVDIQNSIIT